MALTRIPIYIQNVNELMNDFEKIQVFRAETKHGSYSEVSSPATRLCLKENIYNYDFDDYDGSEFYWYKWRPFTDSGAVVGNFSEPMQGFVPGITYCTFDMANRVIRSSEHGRRIKFSDSYKNLRKLSDSQSINLAAISVGPSYAGHERFIINFTSDKNFNMSVYEEPTLAPRMIGSGDVDNDFVANDYSIRINSSDWSGTAVTDDQIEFETDSHMSLNDAVGFIRDSEIFVDMLLEENINFTTPKEYELRFSRNDTPKAIRLATARFSAFFIYSTIYNEQQISGLPVDVNNIEIGERRRHDLSSWAKQAMRLIDGFVAKYTKFFDIDSGDAATTGPRWWNTESLFDANGVAFVGDGIKLPGFDQFRERASMTYDNLLDWDLLAPGSFYYSNKDQKISGRI